MREVLDVKPKEQNPKSSLKQHFEDLEEVKDVVKAASTDEYAVVNNNTAEILKISDKVTQMPDDVALFYVDQATKNYKNKSENIVDEIHKQISPILIEIEEMNKKETREKLKKNYEKIKRKMANLDYAKDIWKQKMEGYEEKYRKEEI